MSSQADIVARPWASAYLILYNLLSALLWSTIFLGTGSIWILSGNEQVWAQMHALARWTETMAAVEVAHAAFGLVRASPLTTALQVAGRNTVLWAIARNYPGISASQWAYSSMLLAWSAADVVRFTYFTVHRVTGTVPPILQWMRYNLFFVLYPVGILSECCLVYKVIEPSRSRNVVYPYLVWLGLSLYIPASYILFTHMLAQRRKLAIKAR